MPNWCSNSMTLRGSDQNEVQRLVNALTEGRLCREVIPIPECLERDGASRHGGPDAAEYDRIRAENQEETGYDSWYDFCCDRWGTKWDVDVLNLHLDEDGLGFSASFDSAWAPPRGVYEELVNQGYEVTAYYLENSNCFAGKWDNGNDNRVDFSDCTSKTVRETVGAELDDFWGISEQMADWEEDEEDESDAD